MKTMLAIITYRRVNVLKTCLDAIKKHGLDKYPVVISEDCGNRDETEAYLTNKQKPIQHRDDIEASEYDGSHIIPGMRCFLGDRNLGVSGNSNRAIKVFMESDCDHLCLCNDDILPLGDFPAFYAKAHEALKVGLLCMCDFEGETYRWVTVRSRGLLVKLLPRLTGIMMSFTRELVEKIGYFDAKFGVFGNEHCCVGTTCIRLFPSGEIRIHDIQVGDTVAGWQSDGEKFVFMPSRVIKVGYREADTVKVVFESGQTVFCTPDHFWKMYPITSSTFANPITGLFVPRVAWNSQKEIVPDKIVEITPAGKQVVYSMETETGNYVAANHASKNCDYTYRARFAGFLKLDGIDQNGIDVDSKPPLVTHQKVETSVRGIERERADRESIICMQEAAKRYRTEHYYRPFALKLPRYAGASKTNGILTENLTGYNLVMSTEQRKG